MAKIPCDKWVVLKICEFLLCVACVVAKRVTDDETSRTFLIRQRLSREWALLTNVTWGRVGAALADATYGGYVIITAGLLISRLTREMPQGRRITEFYFLGLGSILFFLLAGLELFGVEDLPVELVDNAAVLGALSLITGLVFILDLAGPKKITKKTASQTSIPPPDKIEPKSVPKIRDLNETSFPVGPDTELITDWEPYKRLNLPNLPKPVQTSTTSVNTDMIPQPPAWMTSKPNGMTPNGWKKKPIIQSEIRPSSPLMVKPHESHSPVWSRIRSQPHHPHLDNIQPITKEQITSFLLPMPELPDRDNSSPETAASSPIDPGYVQYTAEKWGQNGQKTKTPRHSPTEV